MKFPDNISKSLETIFGLVVWESSGPGSGISQSGMGKILIGDPD
jgi:hypothetical protein